MQLLGAVACHLGTLEKSLRIIHRTTRRQGAQAIDRMGFTNVNDKERGRLTILAVEFFQAPGLAGERRSCVAPEDQHDRLLVLMLGQPDKALFIQLDMIRRGGAFQQGESEVRGAVTWAREPT